MKYPLIIIVVLLAVVAAVYSASNHYLTKQNSCSGQHKTWLVKIQNDHVQPLETNSHRCDKLTILNLDKAEREMAFGQHEHHVAYDGVTERLLNQGQSFTVTLDQKGSFVFHDHFNDDVSGSFIVN